MIVWTRPRKASRLLAIQTLTVNCEDALTAIIPARYLETSLTFDPNGPLIDPKHLDMSVLWSTPHP
jgi:hypothetical protein